MSLCIVLAIGFFSLLAGMAMIEPMKAYGQAEEKMGLSQEFRRDPFLLPSGVRLLSNSEPAPGKFETKAGDLPSPTSKLKAILISDHIRLASIDRSIVTIGDSIYGEKVLEIKADRVILGKGDTKRTIFLDQSPIKLTVETK